MKWLYLLGIVLLLYLIGAIRVNITLIYRSEPEIFLRILFFRFRLVPGKQKKIKLKDYRIDRFRKMRLKERAKLREKARRSAEKKAQKEAKKAENAEKKAKAKKKSLGQKAAELKGKIDFGLEIAKGVAAPLVKRFGRNLHIEIKRIKLIVATGDAAKTAQAYGISCAAVSDLLALLEQTMHIRYLHGAEVAVIPDFVSDTTQMDIDIRFWLRIRNILALPFGAIVDFIKVFLKRT